MPEVMIDLSIKNIAKIINSMTTQEIETLYMHLTEEGEELLRRKSDLVLNKAEFLTRGEVFDI